MQLAEQLQSFKSRCKINETVSARMPTAKPALEAFDDAFDYGDLSGRDSWLAVQTGVRERILQAAGQVEGSYGVRLQSFAWVGPSHVGRFAEMLPRLVVQKTGTVNPEYAKELLQSEGFIAAIKELGSSGQALGHLLVGEMDKYRPSRPLFTPLLTRGQEGDSRMMEQNFELNDSGLSLTRHFLATNLSHIGDMDLKSGYCPALVVLAKEGETVFDKVLKWTIQQFLNGYDFAAVESEWQVSPEGNLFRMPRWAYSLDSRLYAKRSSQS